MKVGDLIESPNQTIRGIIVEVESDHRTYNSGPAVRVKWFDGDESWEWTTALGMISESR